MLPQNNHASPAVDTAVYQQSLQSGQEKTLLLEISQSIARTDNKTDFLRNLDAILKPLFKNTDAGIMIVDWDKSTFTDLYALFHQQIPSTEESKWLNKLYADKSLPTMPFKGSLTEYAMNQPPWMGRLDEVQIWGFDAPFLAVEIENGLTHFMCAPLKVSGQTFGLFNLFFIEQNAPHPAQLSLFAQLADIIAVALANLLVKEEMLARGEEKSRLLEITKLIAQVKDNSDLLRLIMHKVQPMFGFHDCGLFVLSADKKNHTDLAAVITGMSQSEWNNHIEQVSSKIEHAGSPVEWMMAEVERKNYPVIISFADLVARFPEYPQFAPVNILELGYQDCLFTNLKVRGETIGMFCINTLQKDFFGPALFPVFQAVTETISVAVANILAHEEILAREQEKGLLLSLSEQMATIRNRDDLRQVVAEKIQPLVGFDDAVISSFSADLSQYKHIITIAPPERRAHPDFDKITGHFVPVEGPAEWMLEKLQDSPVMRIDTKAFQEAFPENSIFRFLEDTGLIYNLYAKLSYGGRITGFVSFHFTHVEKIRKADFDLYKAITEQISIALANVLANEEILQRAAEKSLELNTLQIINQLHTISSFKDQLETLRQVASEINKVVSFDLLVSNMFFSNLHFLSTCFELKKAGDGSFQPLALPESFSRRDPVTLEAEKAAKAPMSELFTTSAVYTGAAFEEICRKYPNPNMARLHYGIRAVMYVPVTIFNKKAGVIIIASKNPEAFTWQHLQLLQHIFNQLSMGIENLLICENAERNEKEKTILLEKIKEEEEIKSVLLSINNNLINIQDRTTLLQQLAAELSKLMLIDTFGLKTIHENNRFSERLFFSRKPDNTFEPLLAMPPEMQDRIDELDQHEILMPLEQSVIYVGENFEYMCQTYPLYRMAKEKKGIQSVLLAPLKSREGRKSLLVIKSKKAYAYHTNELLLLDRILPQLAIVMENFISYDNIKQLKNLLEAENVYLQEEVKTLYNFEEIIGKGEVLQDALEKTHIVATTDTTVLLLGETGTGKELFARAIHNLSHRSIKPLIKINCAALPPHLIESELFGHERGAFTGAIDRRIGKFELAHGSTLFLDEIGEMPLEVQSKLLRAIQEKEIERLGGNKTIKVDVRIIAATNRDLQKEVQLNRFRSDLYFRLDVFPITLPALRERKEDLPLLVTHFIDKFAKKLGKPLKGITTQALHELQAYHYPGNIRELEHILERSAILSKTPLIKEVYLPKNSDKPAISPTENFRIKTFEENERDYILQVLKSCKGRIYGVGGAADLLELPPTTLASKMKKLGIRKEHMAG